MTQLATRLPILKPEETGADPRVAGQFPSLLEIGTFLRRPPADPATLPKRRRRPREVVRAFRVLCPRTPVRCAWGKGVARYGSVVVRHADGNESVWNADLFAHSFERPAEPKAVDAEEVPK